VRNFVQALGEDQAADLLRTTIVACMGRHGDACERLEIEANVVPKDYTMAGLVAADRRAVTTGEIAKTHPNAAVTRSASTSCFALRRTGQPDSRARPSGSPGSTGTRGPRSATRFPRPPRRRGGRPADAEHAPLERQAEQPLVDQRPIAGERPMASSTAAMAAVARPEGDSETWPPGATAAS